MSGEKNQIDWKWWGAISVFLIAILIVLVLYVNYIPKTAPEIVLSALLVISIIALLVALAFTTIIFKTLDLANKRHALGLPEGSIRAVIALSLILIFIIGSIFLYWQVDNSGKYVSKGLTEEQIDALPNGSVVSIVRIPIKNSTPNSTPLYDVTILVEKSNKTSEDLAQQIITTISTLVVAIAAFYFGTQAVMTAKGTPEISAPVILSVDPKKGKQNEEIKEFKVLGKNLELAKEVRLLCSTGDKIPCTDVTSNTAMITCKMKIPEKAPISKWTVEVINSDKGEARLEDAFETEEATTSSS